MAEQPIQVNIVSGSDLLKRNNGSVDVPNWNGNSTITRETMVSHYLNGHFLLENCNPGDHGNLMRVFQARITTHDDVTINPPNTTLAVVEFLRPNGQVSDTIYFHYNNGTAAQGDAAQPTAGTTASPVTIEVQSDQVGGHVEYFGWTFGPGQSSRIIWRDNKHIMDRIKDLYEGTADLLTCERLPARENALGNNIWGTLELQNFHEINPTRLSDDPPLDWYIRIRVVIDGNTIQHLYKYTYATDLGAQGGWGQVIDMDDFRQSHFFVGERLVYRICPWQDAGDHRDLHGIYLDQQNTQQNIRQNNDDVHLDLFKLDNARSMATHVTEYLTNKSGQASGRWVYGFLGHNLWAMDNIALFVRIDDNDHIVEVIQHSFPTLSISCHLLTFDSVSL